MPEGSPAFRLVDLSVTVPANTPKASPLAVDVNLGTVEVAVVHVLVPTGAVGLVGWRLRWSGGLILPWDAPDGWVVGNGQLFRFPLGLVVTGKVRVEAHNLDVLYPHRVSAWAEVVDVRPGALAAVATPPSPLEVI